MQSIKKEMEMQLQRMTTKQHLPSTISTNMVTSLSANFLESLGEGRRLNEMSLKDVQQIVTAFAALIGVHATNMPTQEVMVVTIQALVRNFGSMYEGEVRKAFEMAATGHLEVEEHYQTLSLKYICSVLNAFRIRVNQEMRFVNNKHLEMPTEKFEGEVDWSDTVKHLIDVSKTQDPKTLIIPIQIYDFLINRKLVTLTGEEKKKFMQKAESEFRQELQEKIIGNKADGEQRQWYELLKTSSYKKGDRLHETIAMKAKKIVVREYLKSQH